MYSGRASQPTEFSQVEVCGAETTKIGFVQCPGNAIFETGVLVQTSFGLLSLLPLSNESPEGARLEFRGRWQPCTGSLAMEQKNFSTPARLRITSFLTCRSPFVASAFGHSLALPKPCPSSSVPSRDCHA